MFSKLKITLHNKENVLLNSHYLEFSGSGLVQSERQEGISNMTVLLWRLFPWVPILHPRLFPVQTFKPTS
jgi:hypothetical protein